MINVNQITSMLAKLPDQALQQYAAMHKSDPYIMALAVAESNRRKEIRGAAQAAQGQMEQPKVNEQALAAMAPAPQAPAPQAALPEEQGIAQLPAGDMNFADGGIVAFAGGGDVERYQDRGLVAPSYGHGMVDPSGLFGVHPESLAFDELRRQEILRKRKAAEDAERLKFLESAAPETAQRIKAESAAPSTAPTYPDEVARRTRSGVAAPAAVAATRKTTGPELLGGPASQAPAPSASQAAASSGLPDVAGLFAAATKDLNKSVHPYADELKAINQARTAAAEENVRGLEAIHEKFSDIYKGRRERLDKRESELGKLKDQGLGLAMLQAGAAMMSTPGNFGAALGKGVKVGTEQYAAGLDKLQSAKEKLSDARDRLEEVEAQRGELSARELLKARNEVKSIGLSGREDLIKANMQMYGLNREQAIKMVDAQVKVSLTQFEQTQQNIRSQADNASRERAAQIAAGAQLSLLRAVAADPALQAVYGRGASGGNKLMDEYAKFLDANPQYLTREQEGLQAFLRTKGALASLGGGAGQGGAGAAPGQLLPRKD